MFFPQDNSLHGSPGCSSPRRSQGRRRSSQSTHSSQQQQHTQHHGRPRVIAAVAAVLSASLSTSKSFSFSTASLAVAADSAVHSTARRTPATAATAAASPHRGGGDRFQNDLGSFSSAVASQPRAFLVPVAATTAGPIAHRNSVTRAPGSASPPLSSVVVHVPRNTNCGGHNNRNNNDNKSTVTLSSLGADPPLTGYTPNDQTSETQLKSSTDVVAGAVAITLQIMEASPTSNASPARLAPSLCRNGTTNDAKIREFVREAVNESDMPPGLLHFLRRQKKQDKSPIMSDAPSLLAPGTATTNTATPSFPPTHTIEPTTSELPPALSLQHSRTQRPSVLESTSGKQPGTVPALPLLTLTSPAAKRPPPPPQPQQQGLPRPGIVDSNAVQSPFRLADTTTTATTTSTKQPEQRQHHHSSEASATNIRTGIPAPEAPAPSEVRDILKRTENDHPCPYSSSGSGNLPNAVLLATRSGQHGDQVSSRNGNASNNHHTGGPRILSNSDDSKVRMNSHDDKTAPLLLTKQTAPAHFSTMRQLDSVQDSLSDGKRPQQPQRQQHHHRFTPFPPTFKGPETAEGTGDHTESGGSSRCVADLDSLDAGFCLQYNRQSPLRVNGNEASVASLSSSISGALPPTQALYKASLSLPSGPSGLLLLRGVNSNSNGQQQQQQQQRPTMTESSRRGAPRCECDCSHVEDHDSNGAVSDIGVRYVDYHNSKNEGDDIVSNASSKGVKPHRFTVSAPGERKRCCFSTRRALNPSQSTYPSTATCGSPLPMELVRAPTLSSITTTSTINPVNVPTTASPSPATKAAANFTINLAGSLSFSTPRPTIVTPTGSFYKKKPLLVVRNMEDASPVLLQQHYQQQPTPIQSSQRCPPPPTFTSTFIGGASLMNDSASSMKFMQNSDDSTPLSPSAEMEPSFMAGVVWMDAISPSTSFTTPTTTPNANCGSTVFTNSTTQNMGVVPLVASLALSECTVGGEARPVMVSSSLSQSLARSQRRPHTTHTPLTAGHASSIVSASMSFAALPATAPAAALSLPPSSGKCSGWQSSHEHRAPASAHRQQEERRHTCQHLMLGLGASFDASAANSTINSNIHASPAPDRTNFVCGTAGGTPLLGQQPSQQHQQPPQLLQTVATTSTIVPPPSHSSSSTPYNASPVVSVSFMCSSSTSAY